MKLLRIRDRAMTSHDVCTSGSSRVLTVVSLQRLKVEVLIPAPADYVVRSVIEFFLIIVVVGFYATFKHLRSSASLPT